MPPRTLYFGEGSKPTGAPTKTISCWQVAWQRIKKKLNQVFAAFRDGVAAVLDRIRALGRTFWFMAFIPGLSESFKKLVSRRFLSGFHFNRSKISPQGLKNKTLQKEIQEFQFNLKDQFRGGTAYPFRFKQSPLNLSIDPKTDNIKLYSWYIPAKSGSQKPTVVIHQGRDANMLYLEKMIQAYRSKGYGVFAYDYPGFGRSEGRADEAGLYKAGVAASLFLKNLQKQGVPVSNQIIVGHSLGSIIASNVAKALETMNLSPKGLVIISSFKSLRDTWKYHVERYGLSRIFNPKRIPLDLNAEESLTRIQGTPVLMIHGMKDRVTPIVQAEAMFKELQTTGEKVMYRLPNAYHSLKESDHRDIVAQVEKFVSAISPKPEASG